MPNWSAKVEYLYDDLGTLTQNFGLATSEILQNDSIGSVVFGVKARARVNGKIVHAGVKYHFKRGGAARWPRNTDLFPT